MNEYLNILNVYLDGKPIYIKLVRLFSLLFIICISSYLYKYFIEDYTFLEINDYKGMLFFLFNGDFAVPLTFFAIIFFVTEIPGRLLKLKELLETELPGHLRSTLLPALERVLKYVKDEVNDRDGHENQDW